MGAPEITGGAGAGAAPGAPPLVPGPETGGLLPAGVLTDPGASVGPGVRVAVVPGGGGTAAPGSVPSSAGAGGAGATGAAGAAGARAGAGTTGANAGAVTCGRATAAAPGVPALSRRAVGRVGMGGTGGRGVCCACATDTRRNCPTSGVGTPARGGVGVPPRARTVACARPARCPINATAVAPAAPAGIGSIWRRATSRSPGTSSAGRGSARTLTSTHPSALASTVKPVCCQCPGSIMPASDCAERSSPPPRLATSR